SRKSSTSRRTSRCRPRIRRSVRRRAMRPARASTRSTPRRCWRWHVSRDDEELARQLAEELKKLRVEDVVIQSLVQISSIGYRRPGLTGGARGGGGRGGGG